MSNVGFTGPSRDRDEMRRRNMADLTSLVALFEPDRKTLRFDPVANARRLRALAIAGSHPALVGDQPLSAEEIVSLFLDGAAHARDEGALMLKMLWRPLAESPPSLQARAVARRVVFRAVRRSRR
jgi:hypothetical protein